MRSLGIPRRGARAAGSRLQALAGVLRGQLTAANAVGMMGAVLALFLLLTLHEPWNIRLPLYLILTVWVILRPRVALYLLPLSIPWGALDYISLGSLRFDSTDILVMLLGIAWLLSYVLGPAHPATGPRDHTSQSLPPYLLLALLGLLGGMVISMTVAISLKSSLKELLKWLEFLVIIVAGSGYIRTRRQAWTIVVMSVLAALSQAFLGYYQEIFNIGPASFIRGESLRVYGTFNQPNPYAGYINMSLALVLALALTGGQRRTRILAACATLLLAVAEFFSQSRGGWLAISSATLFIALVGLPLIRPLWRMLLLGVGLFVEGLLIGVIPQKLFDPLINFVGLNGISFTNPTAQQYPTAERLAHWLAGIHMFLDHLWLGVGIGNYGDAYPHYAIGIFVIPLGHAHNYFINVAAEMGLLGLGVYTLFLTVVGVAGARVYRRLTRMERALSRPATRQRSATAAGETTTLPGPHLVAVPRHASRELLRRLGDDRALALGILAVFVAILMHNMVDNLYVQGMTTLMALLLIVLIRLEQVAGPAEMAQSESGLTSVR